MSGEGHLDEKLIVMYRDGELNHSAARRAESHLNRCEVCRRRLEEFSELYSQLRGWELPGLPGDFADTVMARLPEIPRSRPFNAMLAAAAGFAVLCMVFLISVLQFPVILKVLLETVTAARTFESIISGFMLLKTVIAGMGEIVSPMFKVAAIVLEFTVKTAFKVFISHQLVFVAVAAFYLVLQRFYINYLAAQKR